MATEKEIFDHIALASKSDKHLRVRQTHLDLSTIIARVVRIDRGVVLLKIPSVRKNWFISVPELIDITGGKIVKPGELVSVNVELLKAFQDKTKLGCHSEIGVLLNKTIGLGKWCQLEIAMEDGKIIEGKVNGKVQEGLVVTV